MGEGARVAAWRPTAVLVWLAHRKMFGSVLRNLRAWILTWSKKFGALRLLPPSPPATTNPTPFCVRWLCRPLRQY